MSLSPVDWPMGGTDATQPSSEISGGQIQRPIRRELRAMRVTRVIFAAFLVLVGSAIVLERAAAEPNTETYRTYLSMVTVDAGPSDRASNNVPDAVISVAAWVVSSCQDHNDVRTPVKGARITVITEESPLVDFTDMSGRALFSATTEPAVVQLEWPVGFLPCPNSRPLVELPNGAGDVEFFALIRN